METVRQQFAELTRRAERDPKYWSRVLAGSAYRGVRLADLKHLPERFEAYTRRDVQAALARYVIAERRLAVTCRPAPLGWQG